MGWSYPPNNKKSLGKLGLPMLAGEAVGSGSECLYLLSKTTIIVRLFLLIV